jgi:Leucine-rich repeat (LRR) protein
MKKYLGLTILLAVFGAGCSEPRSVATTPVTNTVATPSAASSGVLDLSGKGLTSIPADVFTRTDLEYLDLSGNRLTGAPQSQIGQLKNLTFLDLSDNALTGLPAELGKLSKLETLDASNNNLTGLPMEIGNLTQLRLLDVSGNDYSKQDLEQIAAKLVNTQIKR